MLRTTRKGRPLHNRLLEYRNLRTKEVLRSSQNILVIGIKAVATLSLTRGENKEVYAWDLVQRHQASSMPEPGAAESIGFLSQAHSSIKQHAVNAKMLACSFLLLPSPH